MATAAAGGDLLGRLYVQFEASGNLNDLVQQQEAKVKALDAALASGTFKDFVRKQDEIAAAMKRANAEADKQAAAVRGQAGGAGGFGGAGGGFGGGGALAAIGGALGGALGAAQGALTSFASVVGLAVGAIAGFVAAASPEAMETFTGSLKLLAGQIGVALVPVLTTFSYALQMLREIIKPISAGLGKMLEALAGPLLDAMSAVADVVMPLAEAFGELLGAIGSLIDWLNSKLKESTGKGVGDWIAAAFTMLKPFTGYLEAVQDLISKPPRKRRDMMIARPRGGGFVGIAEYGRQIQLNILNRNDFMRESLSLQGQALGALQRIANNTVPQGRPIL
jgi:hypothetical protein